jgi:hypothetical protein
MIDKFELLLDLLDIEDKQSYLDVAMQIQEGKYKKIKTLHKYGFVFGAFNDFLNNKITLQDFIKIWDIEWEISIKQQNFDVSIFSGDCKKYVDTLFVISSINLWWKFSNSEIQLISKKLEDLGSQLCVI